MRLMMIVVSVGLLSGCGGAPTSSTQVQAYTPPPIPPAPTISISPASAAAGSPDIQIAVTGSNVTFKNETHYKSWAMWRAAGKDDTFLQTTFVTDTRLTAVIPADLMKSPVSADVVVETGDPMGCGGDPEETAPFVVR